jgi:nicotinamidase-related amidase
MPMRAQVRKSGTPARRRRALLLIDFMNPFDFDGGAALAPRALMAARRTARLREKMRAAHVPVVYANDNFGRWEADFAAVIAHCRRQGGASAQIANLLAPAPGERSILKPRHSAFFGTPLEFLLDELRIDELVLTGIAADSCIMFTAHDAYLRKYALWVPGDCVASEQDAYRRAALAYMTRTLKADVTPVGHGSRAGRVRPSAARDRRC